MPLGRGGRGPASLLRESARVDSFDNCMMLHVCIHMKKICYGSRHDPSVLPYKPKGNKTKRCMRALRLGNLV